MADKTFPRIEADDDCLDIYMDQFTEMVVAREGGSVSVGVWEWGEGAGLSLPLDLATTVAETILRFAQEAADGG